MRGKAALYRVFVPAFAVAVAVAFAAGCSFGENESETRARNVAQEVPEVSADIPEDEPAARVAAQVGPSVVQVNVRAVQATPFGGVQEGSGVGSGVIYRRDGYIITNNHVVEGANGVNIAFADGSTETGEVVGTDPSTEIAVVRVDREDLPAARFAEAGTDLIPGQLAVAIGSPSGFQSTVTAGIISGLNREIPAEITGGRREEALVDLIQTDAPISPGNSGGALLNRDGEVVGVNVAYLPPESGVESIGFAVPSDTVVSVADQLIESGRVSRPFLGISNRDLTPEIAEQFDLPVQRGVIVVEIEPGSPADRAGLEREDVVTALGSTPIEGSGDLLGALRDYRPGDTVTLTVLRGGAGSEESVEVELGERPR